MRAAEPVEVPLAPGRRERVLIAALHLAAGLLLGAWLLAHAAAQQADGVLAWWLRPIAGLVPALMTAAGLLAGRRCLPAVPGRLRWDGRAWQLRHAGAEQPLLRLVVALDLGPWLLLRLHGAAPGAACWRVVDARTAGPQWHALRLALASHAGAVPQPPPG